jgi:hypothetical protein
VSTITIPRSDVTAQEVSAVLRDRLGSRYRITPAMTSRGLVKEVPGDANSMLVRGTWFERANVRLVPGTDTTEIQVSPGAIYPGLVRLIDRVSIARKVRQALENAPELARPN